MLCVLYTIRVPCQKYYPKIACPRSVHCNDCLYKCKRALCWLRRFTIWHVTRIMVHWRAKTKAVCGFCFKDIIVLVRIIKQWISLKTELTKTWLNSEELISPIRILTKNFRPTLKKVLGGKDYVYFSVQMPKGWKHG